MATVDRPARVFDHRRMGCLDDQAIVDLIEGRTTEADRAVIEEHIDACPTCRALVAAMARGERGGRGEHGGRGERGGQSAPPLAQPGERTDPADRGPGLFGRYLLERRLGSGAMGTVYRARDPELEREVAVKVVRADIAEGARAEELHARLLREARTLAKLSHPNVVTVFDAGVWEERVFIAMELVEGMTLGRWLQQEQPGAERVLELYLAAGRGLAAAHAAGVVHRDFKPDNVLIGADARPRVVDFGLSRAVARPLEDGDPQRGPEETRSGALIGTPAYMSPEQLAGATADARSDQFSFAAALWEALYGQRPFAGTEPSEIAASIRAAPPKPPPGSRVERSDRARRRVHPADNEPRRVPRALSQLLIRALAPDPDKRFAELSELLDALAKVEDRRRRRRKWMMLGAIGGALLIALSLGIAELRRCPSSAALGEEVFGLGPRKAIHETLRRSGAPYAEDTWATVERLLGLAAEQWATAEHARCLGASGDRPCLERARAELSALTQALANTAEVEQAVRAVTELRVACDPGMKGAPALPEDPAKKSEVERIQAELPALYSQIRLGRWAEALAPARDLLRAAEASGHRPTEAEAAYYLGEIEIGLDQLAAAKETLKHAARAGEAGRHDRAAANAHISLVYLAAHRSDFAEGEEHAKDAAAALERLGPAPALEAALATNVGSLAWAQVDLERAERELSRALSIEERFLGPEHLQLAETLEGLAGVQMDRYELESAAKAHERALAIRAKALGPNHPLVANSLDRLGGVRWGQGRLVEARSKMESAVSLAARVLPEDSAALAEYRNNLALVCQELGDLECASTNIDRALAVDLVKLGPRSHATAIARLNRGSILRERGQLKDARAETEAALEVLQAVVGPEHADVAMARYYLGEIDRAEGRWAEALANYQTGLQIERSALGADYPDGAFFLTGIGLVELARHRPAAALAPLEEALRLRHSKPVKARERRETEAALAEALRATGKDPALVKALLLRGTKTSTQ